MQTYSHRHITALNHGGPEVLELRETEIAEPKGSELLVRVAAAGVNFIDTYQRSGLYPTRLPFTPGIEFSGEVVGIGPEVAGFAVGDRVATAAGRAGYAELAIAEAHGTVKVPDSFDLVLAAAVPLQGATAHFLANSSYPLGPDDTALIHAGAGGVGQLLIQLAKAKGTTVIATASTDQKRALAEEAGADHAIPYENFAERVRSITGGRGADVVYDGVGKSTFEESLASLRVRGELVVFGGASGPVPPFDLQLLNRAGSVKLSRPSLWHFLQTPEETDRRFSELFAAVSAGSLNISVTERIPLAEAAQAHTLLEGRKTTGKILLIP